MAQPRERTFNHSPRSSSGGAESVQGTPDTRVTTFSPDEEISSASKHKNMFEDLVAKLSPLGVSSDRTQSDDSTGTSDKDPFVTPNHAFGTALSPTASAFSPYTGSIYASTISGGFKPAESTTRHLRVSSLNGVAATEVEHWLKVS